MTYAEMVAGLKPEIGLTDEMVIKLRKYSSLLQEWNQKFNLTAITEESEIVEKHFFDCLIPAKGLNLTSKTLADLGSGAGFPGLVWAIAFPTCQVTLVEATGKKCVFLETVAKECGLPNVKVLNKRCEELNERERFDIVTARALAPMGTLLEIGAPLVKVGGLFIAMKGSKGEEEFNKTGKEAQKLGLTFKELKKEDLPNGVGTRQNFFFLKTSKTPTCYPRPWATILKKPLL
jgi:16S rRNA (guanine527-N7)-methyltransferase